MTEKINRKINLHLFDKKRINNKCFICDKHFFILEIHHKDKNPNNNKTNNLLIVCKSCHNLIHNNKEVDKDLPTKKRYLIKLFRYKLRKNINR